MKCDTLALIGFRGVIAEGIKSALNGSNFKIRYQVGSLAEFWDRAGKSIASVSGIILDTDSLAVLQPSDLKDIRHRSKAAKIVLMASESRSQEVMNLARHADSVFLSSGSSLALLKSLELVLLGQRVYPAGLFESTPTPEPVGDAEQRDIEPAHPAHNVVTTAAGFWTGLRNLSQREVQVVNLLCDGSPNKIIARKLEISEATVKVHVKAILRKTRARNRTEAAVLFRSLIRSGDAGPEVLPLEHRISEGEARVSQK